MKKGYLRHGFFSILAVCALVFLVSCGDKDDDDTGNTASISLSASSSSIPADGSSSTTITASLVDSLGSPVEEDTSIAFSTSLGTFQNNDSSYRMSTSGDSGSVIVSLISGTTPGDAQVTATSNSVSQSIAISFTSDSGSDTGASISLATSQVSVKSDNSDSATITATVLDEDNVVAEGVTVSFSTDGGQLSDSSLETDENGQTEIEFSSGTVDKSNQVATITAEVAGIDSAQIPIQITGTTVSLSTDSTNLTVGGSSVTLTIAVKDAGSVGVYDAPVSISVSPTGILSLSQDTGNTDVSGELEVDVTGIGVGNATVTVESLGATATQTYTVGTSGTVFGISSPTQDPCSLSTGTYPTGPSLNITVNAPSQTSVQFATTIGEWDGGGNVVTKTVSSGTASAILTSSDTGTANVEVSDPADPTTTDTLTVAISAPDSEATQISLQASAYVVAPSIGDISNSVTLTAIVRNDSDDPVGSAAVAFSIENPTGGGESISPVIVYTDTSGVATSTFTSGSSSSDALGVTVTASLLDGLLDTDSIQIIIGGAAGSVVIGVSTEISSNDSETIYIYPMSVLIADSNGNPVSGAIVTLSVWPTRYATGYWDDEEGLPVWTGQYDNEDINQNLILDSGPPDYEDDMPSCGSDPGCGDGILTPPSSAAGTLPGSVTTDEYGVANFELIYLKSSSVWIEAEVTASTEVFGSEDTSSRIFWLPYRVGDEEHLSDSPYGM
ncbi:MAG: Ig-like domain-containing protein [Thermodesulfobacteriota bacterium]|nr:Ig-like domain-containing protein [Thermodesulfobacteriota bacterium]